MKQSHLATAAFWIGLLTLFGWQASAQIPRPPMPIPNVSAPRRQHRPGRPHAANRPPDAVGTNPNPAASPGKPAPTPAMMPVLLHVALPPAEYRSSVHGEAHRAEGGQLRSSSGTSVATPPTPSRVSSGPTTPSAARRSPA